MAQSRITLIGGGTGSYTLLQALKTVPADITALVNMADDGGSTGILRDELGVLPPGDVRQCLVALSDASPELRELFTFRFPHGSLLAGHSFGNIFLSAVEKMTNNFEDGVRLAGDILRIRGRVLPMTLDDCQLVMKVLDKQVIGQRAVELTNLADHARPSLSFTTDPTILLDAKAAILEADLVVIAPGNLYASLAPALIVPGVAEALHSTKARVAFVCNLVNKPNHTASFTVHDYASEIERLTHTGILDYVLYNQDEPSAELLHKYALDQEFPVLINQQDFKQATYEAVGGNFLSHEPVKRNPNDNFIVRSLIRHDARAVVDALMKLY